MAMQSFLCGSNATVFNSLLQCSLSHIVSRTVSYVFYNSSLYYRQAIRGRPTLHGKYLPFVHTGLRQKIQFYVDMNNFRFQKTLNAFIVAVKPTRASYFALSMKAAIMR